MTLTAGELTRVISLYSLAVVLLSHIFVRILQKPAEQTQLVENKLSFSSPYLFHSALRRSIPYPLRMVDEQTTRDVHSTPCHLRSLSLNHPCWIEQTALFIQAGLIASISVPLYFGAGDKALLRAKLDLYQCGV